MLQSICTKARKKVIFSYNKVLLQNWLIYCGHFWRNTLFGSEHFLTDSKFSDCKVSFRLLSKKKTKKTTKQKRSLELWLCNQTSRQILIFSKLFPSFHYNFRGFHLDFTQSTIRQYLCYSSSHSRSCCSTCASWPFEHSCCIRLWLLQLFLTWIRNEWPGVFWAESPNNFWNDSSCKAALVHDSPPRKPHFNPIFYPSIRGMGWSERGKTSKARVQKRCSAHNWASKYPFLFILRLPHQIFPDILYSHLNTFK